MNILRYPAIIYTSHRISIQYPMIIGYWIEIRWLVYIKTITWRIEYKKYPIVDHRISDLFSLAKMISDSARRTRLVGYHLSRLNKSWYPMINYRIFLQCPTPQPPGRHLFYTGGTQVNGNSGKDIKAHKTYRKWKPNANNSMQSNEKSITKRVPDLGTIGLYQTDLSENNLKLSTNDQVYHRGRSTL